LSGIPGRIILTSIDYVKGLEFFSVILPVPFKDDLDQFQKARVYTSITRATDDLTIFLIEE
jgi:DNA helicase IV